MARGVAPSAPVKVAPHRPHRGSSPRLSAPLRSRFCVGGNATTEPRPLMPERLLYSPRSYFMDWNLIGWSFTVIRRNKQLALFPAFSAAAALAGLWLFAQLRYGGLAPLAQKGRFGLDDYAWL